MHYLFNNKRQSYSYFWCNKHVWCSIHDPTNVKEKQLERPFLAHARAHTYTHTHTHALQLVGMNQLLVPPAVKATPKNSAACWEAPGNMAEVVSPITQQVRRERWGKETRRVDLNLKEVEDCLIHDRHGNSFPFKGLYQDRKSVIVFVRNFLCYSCKEYVDDLSKVPREALEVAGIRLVVIGQSSYHHIEPFCMLTGYPYEIYVDPQRCLYQKLGMRREETFTDSARPSPHVKSGLFMGQMKSIWRAMTSPAFDFQGDLHQQGGAIIAGPDSQVHFVHFDLNRLDHMPISWLLQLAGVRQTLDFSDEPKIIHV
uniref:Peroxiredoxin like 2C n=6 Tax=Nothobranchius TaxID=28779 RepID=A0A8C6LLS7_NOTFU